MKHLTFALILSLTLFITNCSPPKEDDAVVATEGGGGGGGGGGGASDTTASSFSVAAHLTPQSRIATGYDSNSYILDNGSVIHWGYYSDENAAKNTNIVDNLTNPRQVATFGSSANGGRHDCAILTDNTSVCWGENSQSQLGDNTTVDCGVGVNSTTPKFQKTACAVPIFDDATAQGNLKEVATAEKFTIWLDNNGKVYSAGDCDSGRLGVSCSSTDHKIGTTVMTGVKDIDAYKNIACAHKTDDTLHCWGENSSNGITSANSNDVETPLQIAASVNKFDVGSGFVAMVHDNGSVFCTDNFYQNNLCSTRLNYPNIKQIYATGVAGLVFDNGTTISYGYNYQGATANKSGNNPQTQSTPSQGWIREGGSDSLIDNVSHMSTGGNGHLIAVMDNGSLVVVGGNNEGQIGGTASNLTCYWRGTGTTPCPDSSQANDQFIYLNVSPTSVGP